MVQAGNDSETTAAVQRDVPQAIKLLQEISESIQQATQLVDNMLGRVKRGEMSTAKGLSFLEMKYHTLLSYIINLSYVILRKCSGESIESDPAIERLIELRTTLEKIRPIDHRLKYQIDKLLKIAVTGSSAEGSRFRANPANMASKLGDESEEEDSDEDSEKPKSQDKREVYVPPKLAPMHYDGDESAMTRQEKLKERARRRALSSSLVRELREEYMDAPTELGANVDGIASGPGPAGPSREQRERQDYEEAYFTRLPQTKEDRRKARKLPTLGVLGEQLTNFGDDVEALEGGGGCSSRKRKSATSHKAKKGKGGKGGKGKKRRFH